MKTCQFRRPQKPDGEPATCSLLFREPSKLRQSEELRTPLLCSNWEATSSLTSRLQAELAPGEVGPDLDFEEALLSLRKGKQNTLVIYYSLERGRVTGEESWGTELNPNTPDGRTVGSQEHGSGRSAKRRGGGGRDRTLR